MTDQPPDTPDDLTPYIVPLDQGAPNPYDDPDFDGKQAEVTTDNKVEGLGGDTIPESDLGVHDARNRLHDLAVANATVQWDGRTAIRAMCLSVQHNASGIGALHYDAQQDWDLNPDQHPCTYETADWSKVPDGSWVYLKSAASGSGHGHVFRKFTHNRRPIFCSSDVIPSQIGYVDDATWFRLHWGMEMLGWSRVCNGVWQKGIPGNDQHSNGGGVQWQKAQDAAEAVWPVRKGMKEAQDAVHAIPWHWDRLEDARTKIDAAAAAVNDVWKNLHTINYPEGKK